MGQGWGPTFLGKRTARAQPGTRRLPLDRHCVGVRQTRSEGFPGRPVIKTSPSSVGGVGLIPGWGAKILHVSGSKKQNIKNRSNMGTNSTTTFKMAHVKKKKSL